MGNRFRLKGFHRYKIPPVLKRETDPLRALIDSLFGNGEQGAMYIPQPQALGQQVLFQDAAGTVPVVDDGDPTGRFMEVSGNSGVGTQETSGNRPAYRSVGGRESLLFDGATDRLILSAPMTAPSTSFSCLVAGVANQTGVRGIYKAGSGDLSAGQHYVLFRPAGSTSVISGEGFNAETHEF